MVLDTVAARDPLALPAAALARSTDLFRNQFLLGPRCPEQLLDWPGFAVAGGLWLVTHPELPVTRVVEDKRALTLVGFMLDPEDPVADDRSILTRLLQCCDSMGQLVEGVAALGGRWLLIAECDDTSYLLTDALGLRQALYTRFPEVDGLWVMSQAGFGAELLGLPRDEQASRFLESYTVRAGQPEYYWPGMSSPLRGLRHLLPNHALDLVTGEVRRYWPDGPLPSLTFDQAVERTAALMSGLLCAAAARFDLALSITAGIDSRLVLAAVRPVQDQVSYITVRQAKMDDGSADLRVPARLLARLGLAHEIIRAAGSMSADFSWAFKRNVFLAHDHYGADAEAILARFGRRKVAVTGSGAEVGRCAFRQDLPFSDWRRITAKHLAWLEGLHHPYALRCFDEWLDDVGDCTQVKCLDLFEWEQGQGSWLAMTQLEFDAAWRDIFTPYNCRALLTTMLGVSERYRRGPDCALFRSTARRLWPEVLSEPVNPHKRVRAPARLRRLVGRGVRSYLETR